MIYLIASSYKQGIWIPHTKFRAYNQEDADTLTAAIKHGRHTGEIKQYANGYESFYYPADLGRFLWERHGIETTILAHSGKEVVNGEYPDDYYVEAVSRDNFKIHRVQ